MVPGSLDSTGGLWTATDGGGSPETEAGVGVNVDIGVEAAELLDWKFELHGLSKSTDGTLGFVPLVLAHGFKVLPPPNPRVVLVLDDSVRGVRVVGDRGRSGDDQALISSLLFSSPPPPGPPPSPEALANESLLRSLATPPYASCTTESAADAFVENRPHIDLTPVDENRSDEPARGEGGGFEANLLTRGDGERGMEEGEPGDPEV